MGRGLYATHSQCRELGPMADGFAASVPATPEAIRGMIGAFGAVGLDELVLWPCVPEPDQVDRLADLLG